MKAVISNRIYMEVTPELRDEIDAELSHSIPTYDPSLPPLKIKNMATIRYSYNDTNLITIPSGRTDLIPEGYEIKDRRVENLVDFPEFRATLMEDQEEVYNEIEDCCILNAKPGWGKTFTALAIAAKLGQKTLVVVHTTNLLTQWVEETEKVFGIKPGVIGDGQFRIGDTITIGSVRTLYNHIDKIRKEFGTLLLDEMHHVSSPTFTRIVDSNYARYKIGLSGTIKRKDGKHVVFIDYFGTHILKPKNKNVVYPEVHTIKTDIRFPDGRMPWANKVNILTNNNEYRHLIAMLASVYEAKGHKVLVVSDRVAFLEACAELSGDKAVCVTGTNSSREHRQKVKKEILESTTTNILYGTQAIYSEGESINNLSCLILGTPVNNAPLLEQLIGRIQRKFPGKLKPVVVDIHLKGKTATNQASARMGHYLEQGYKIAQY